MGYTRLLEVPMKKTLVLIPLLFCLLLSACGKRPSSALRAFSQELAQQETLSFTAELTASYPDRTAPFSLRYALEGDVQRVTVLSPGEHFRHQRPRGKGRHRSGV